MDTSNTYKPPKSRCSKDLETQNTQLYSISDMIGYCFASTVVMILFLLIQNFITHQSDWIPAWKNEANTTLSAMAISLYCGSYCFSRNQFVNSSGVKKIAFNLIILLLWICMSLLFLYIGYSIFCIYKIPFPFSDRVGGGSFLFFVLSDALFVFLGFILPAFLGGKIVALCIRYFWRQRK